MTTDSTPTGVALTVTDTTTKRAHWRPVFIIGGAIFTLIAGIGLAMLYKYVHADGVQATNPTAYVTTTSETQSDPVTDSINQRRPPGTRPPTSPTSTQPEGETMAQPGETPPPGPQELPNPLAQNANQSAATANGAVATTAPSQSPAQIAWESTYRAATTPLTSTETPQLGQQQDQLPVMPSAESIASQLPNVNPAAIQALLQGLQGGNGQNPAQQQQSSNRTANVPSDEPTPARRIPPAARYMLSPGTWIHAHLDQRVLSELPGDLVGIVDRQVYDDAQHVMIPQGSRVIGSYGGRVAIGQSRLLQVWPLIVFPDHSTMRLNDLTGNDSDGASGIRDRVNNHVVRLIRDAAITTVFAAGIALTQRQSSSILAAPSVGTTIGQSVGQSIGELGSESLRMNFNREPTIEIRPGAEFLILVNRALIFDGPYAPMKPEAVQ